ncbi:DUF4138 domain-containing protein [Flagellimonas hymeniacidonis]|uniref:DUF4138 domain-containing protein n=1 Tax=Flagellimonas hymeniacidonis TaxID=2603628 RepID=A0A5C8V066_9FLAO|nr:DUF4138 domain-containing protein [Flagellimonas hymeniacidonis]TXN35000.1 DUF4138 domain-containing protein [Flagellimonas hymeniacidonis]
MKIYIIFILAICSNYVNAQQSLDTIYANEKKNVALFFPEPIRQGITGTSNFVFTYNREKEQYFGLLQATPGEESNLLTVIKNGQVYSYILKYKEQLQKLNYFITTKESIGSERPVVLKQKQIVRPPDRIDYFKKFSNHLLKSNSGSIATKRKKGIKLQLQEMVYNASEVYLVLEIKNKSEINFEIDYLNIYKVNGNKKRKASYQKLFMKADYTHEIPNTIKVGQTNRFVYVLPKFVLGDNEKLMMEMSEEKGSRKIVLEN